MHNFYKVCVVSLATIHLSFVASATEVLATREYVVQRFQGERSGQNVTNTHQGDIMQVDGTGYLNRVTPVSDISTAPSTANAVVPVTAGAVYDALEDKEDISNKLDGVTSGEKIGDIAAGSGAGQDQVMYPSAAAVKEYAVQKPTSAAAGQVLTYDTGANANSRPVAKYIQVPVATGDPTSNTVNDVASIWLQ
ncbi:MAG: hypothetical protein IJL21_00980 [Alphaproteobacteria bacterium]|nr:hypothetical protein [Alphaproteobacteria bacterium]